VTDNGCSATGSVTIAILANEADLGVTISAPASIPATTQFDYNVVVSNAGPATAQALTLTVTLPSSVTVGPTLGDFDCTRSSNVLTCSLASLASSSSSTMTIAVTAPQSAGTLNASAAIAATLPDPATGNNSASVTTTVRALPCATSVSLLEPSNNATGLTNPLAFSWSPVIGATSYELFVGSGTTLPASQLITTGTSASLSRPSGAGTWYVIARITGNTCDPVISPTRSFSVATALQCDNAAPRLLSPANGEVLPSPITFTWDPVAHATSYTVFASIDGAPAQDLGNTTATSLAVSLNATSVVWHVQASFAGCPATLSDVFAFRIQRPNDCTNLGVASLIGPAGAVTSSSIEFQWNAVRGVSGYRVWASINGAPFAALGTTDATTLTATIARGSVEWFVESLFNGCSSTESSHLTFTVPAATVCNTSASTPLAPANNTTVFNQSIEFTWQPVPNAIGYEVHISLANGTPTLLGSTTTATSLRHDVAPGNLEWFVRTIFSGCDPVDSQHFTFVFDPPASCPTQRPLLIAPALSPNGLTSPVDFTWTAVAGVSQYRLSYAVNGGAPTTMTLTQPRVDDVAIANGAVSWSVEALTPNCPSLVSTSSTFTVIPPPPQCSTPATSEIRAAANASSGSDYVVSWDPIPGAVSYELQESATSNFSVASFNVVSVTQQTFRHSNETGINAAFFYYRVRGVNNCNSTRGLFSEAIAVGVLPVVQVTNPVGATPVSNPQPITYPLQICTAAAATCSFVAQPGQSFSVATDQDWLTASPERGTVPAGGITVTLTAATSGLAVGTNTAGVTVIFGSAATPDGKVSHDGPASSTTNISVNLVAPVAPTPSNTPPPDALIIPAVAHANGLNAQFQSDIRVTNTSPQAMKYQLTFTPTGDAGIAQGKQATIDVEPGRTVALDDVLSSWFGAGAAATGASGALEIRPLTKSSSSVSSAAVSGLPNIVTFATSRTYSVAGNGSFGTIVPAVPYSNFIGQSKDPLRPAVLSLQQIAQTDTLRTNFGLKEASGQPATVLVTMFGSAGQKLGEFTQNLTGGQHVQINSVLARQNLTNVADGRIEVRVTSATGRVTAYASVLDNKNNDAQLVSPTLLSQTGSARYVLAGVADLTQTVGKTQTDVRLFNPSASAITATLSMYADGATTPTTKEVTIAANEVRTLDAGSFLGVANMGTGALHITTAAPTNLVATARTYTQTATGSLGGFMNAVTLANAITAGSRPLQLLQVEQSNRFSTDVGVAEVSGKAVDVEVSVIPQDSKVALRTVVSLKANESHTMRELLRSVGLDGSYNARVTLKVVGGAGAATAYARVTDLATNDPLIVPGQ
jgi:hypothetical protein